MTTTALTVQDVINRHRKAIADLTGHPIPAHVSPAAFTDLVGLAAHRTATGTRLGKLDFAHRHLVNVISMPTAPAYDSFRTHLIEQADLHLTAAQPQDRKEASMSDDDRYPIRIPSEPI